MNSLISAAYDILAIIEIGILEYVIRQVDNDRINNLDPHWVRWARRGSFTGAELFLCATIYFQNWLWEPSLFDVGLIGFGDLILAVNVISLHLRSPPNSGNGYPAARSGWWRIHRRPF
jgi:hypothetical protein